jgi:histidinol-phosphate aminotransferase
MNPTPGPVAPAPAPAGYAWEATDEQVSERYGVPLASIVRFDLNTSPAPPDLALRLIRAGTFGRPISEYPPSDYRDLVAAAAATYGVGTDELLVGAGADEILDLVAKAFLPPGADAVIPTPTYAMYHVLTEQRPASPVHVPRRPAGERRALDLPAVLAAARSAALVWLCSPNNPTGLPEPAGIIADLLRDLRAGAAREGRIAPIVVLDEAYAEFTGASLVGLRDDYPRLVVVRTASKAYALAGLRVGFAIARHDVVVQMEPYRPPGSVSVPSVAVVAAALRDAAALRENVDRVVAERERLAAALAELGAPAGPSVTNFLLVPFGDRDRAVAAADGLLRRGLVPRTFGPYHALAACLRFTVRAPAEDDRLVAALREIVPALPHSGAPAAQEVLQ